MPHLARPLALAVAVVAGALIAVQSRLNGGLGNAIGGLPAALTSFGVGVVPLALGTAVTGRNRAALAALPRLVRDGHLRWWHLLGGLGGATLVAAQGTTVPTLGVALFSVATVAGQTVNGLAVDHVGLGPGGARAASPARVASAVVAVAAVLLAVSGQLGHETFSLPAILLALVAGALVAIQQAANGQVATATRQPVVATTVNFAVGTVALGIVVATAAMAGGLPASHFPGAGSWWLYLGGPLGIVFVLVAATVVRVLGVLLLSLGVVAGQLSGALALDLLAPAHGARVAPTTLLGVLLTFVAVLVAALPGLRRRWAARGR